MKKPLRMRAYRCHKCHTVIRSTRRPTGWTVKKRDGERICTCPLCLPAQKDDKPLGKLKCKCHKGQPYNYNPASNIFYANFHSVLRRKTTKKDNKRSRS